MRKIVTPTLTTCLVALALAGGCAAEAPGGTTPITGPGGGPSGGPSASPGDGPYDTPDGGPDSREAYCMGRGPRIQIPDNTTSVTVETCSGAIAERVFTYALCTCENANIAGFLSTRSFDSSQGGQLVESGGPVGVNGSYVTAGYADVGGTFTIAGPESVTFAGYLNVGGDLRFAGSLTAAGYIRAARDAWVAGDITVPGYMEIGRDLHQPLGKRLLTVANIAGQTMSEGFGVAPPCACGANELVDVQRLIDDARVTNDNATIALQPGAISNVLGIGQDLELPCGRFYLDSIGGVGAIHLKVPGRTALFVGGDVNTTGALDVDLGTSGELDLFIGGNLISIGASSFGDENRPSASRIYVGGSGDVILIGAQGFTGNVYAPRSRISAPGATFVHGSLFGRTVDIPGYLSVEYDRDILNVGDQCDGPRQPPTAPPPSQPGGTCTQCDNSCGPSQACTGGSCGPCRSDADCCAPLVCYPDGSCGSLLI